MFSPYKVLVSVAKEFSKAISRPISSSRDVLNKGFKKDRRHEQIYMHAKHFKSDIIGDVLYGIHPVRMALMAQRRSFNHLYVNENILDSSKNEVRDILDMAEKLSIPRSIQKNFVLSALSDDRPHQGFCLDAGKLFVQHSISNTILELNKERRFVILDSIQDPQNFGSILRSCYYFGYTKVLTSDKNSCGLTATVSKASSGALELTDIYSVPDLAEFLLENFREEWLLIGTSLSDGTNNLKLEDANSITDKKIAIIFGNEEKGMSKSMEVLCHKHITIPAANQPNLIGCLNVSVATGIILHALQNPKTGSQNTEENATQFNKML